MLPHDIINHILSFYPYDKKIISSLICQNEIFELRKNYLVGKVNIIKRWWRFYTTYTSFCNKWITYETQNYITSSDNFIKARNIMKRLKNAPIISKKMFIHDLIFKYIKNHLFEYPEFYFKKVYDIDIHNKDSLESTPDIPNSLKKILNENVLVEKRTTYNIYQFLKSKDITFYYLLYVGM